MLADADDDADDDYYGDYANDDDDGDDDGFDCDDVVCYYADYDEYVLRR